MEPLWGLRIAFSGSLLLLLWEFAASVEVLVLSAAFAARSETLRSRKDSSLFFDRLLFIW